jgi:hypothetical protein
MVFFIRYPLSSVLISLSYHEAMFPAPPGVLVRQKDGF